MAEHLSANEQHHPTPAHPDLAQQFTRRLVATDPAALTAGAEVEALANALLQDARRERASDIHLLAMDGPVRVRLRIDGDLLDAAVVPTAIGERLLNHFRVMGELDTGHLYRPAESRLNYRLGDQELDLRLTVAPTSRGDVMVIRMLDIAVVEHQLEALGLSHEQRERLRYWLETASGMLLVAGPTGSGKTTTLYALLSELVEANRSIFTLEDPVEHHLPGVAQITIDPEHGLTFASGLRSLLRMDPDYLMVGEMREARAAHAATDAAIRGRIVFSTIHSRDAVGVVTALRNWGLEQHEIAAAMTLVMAQRLVRRLCPHCVREGPLSEDQARWYRAVTGGVEPPARLGEPVGCDRCRGTGYHGRVGLFELWSPDEEDYDMILAGRDEVSMRRRLKEKGHRTLMSQGLAQVEAGVIALEDLRRTPDLLARQAMDRGEPGQLVDEAATLPS